MEIEKHENDTYVKEEVVAGAHCKWFPLPLPLPLPLVLVLVLRTCEAGYFAGADGGAGLAHDVRAQTEADQVDRLEIGRRRRHQKVDEGGHVGAGARHVHLRHRRVVETVRQRRPVHRNEVALLLRQVRCSRNRPTTSSFG